MIIEKAKLPPAKKHGPIVRRIRRSDWGTICDRYVTGDSVENLGLVYGTSTQNITRCLSMAKWRIWRATRVLSGEKYAVDHRPIEDGFTPWLEEKVRTNTLIQLQWFLSKLPEVTCKPRKVKKP